MKTKDYLRATLSGFSIAIVLAVVSFILVSCGNSKDTRPTSGYIPVDVKPQISWSYDGYTWDRIGYIRVMTAKGLMTVRFQAVGSWLGSFAVVYRDTYPRSIGKRVDVNLYYDDAGMPWVSSAFVIE